MPNGDTGDTGAFDPEEYGELVDPSDDTLRLMEADPAEIERIQKEMVGLPGEELPWEAGLKDLPEPPPAKTEGEQAEIAAEVLGPVGETVVREEPQPHMKSGPGDAWEIVLPPDWDEADLTPGVYTGQLDRLELARKELDGFKKERQKFMDRQARLEADLAVATDGGTRTTLKAAIKGVEGDIRTQDENIKGAKAKMKAVAVEGSVELREPRFKLPDIRSREQRLAVETGSTLMGVDMDDPWAGQKLPFVGGDVPPEYEKKEPGEPGYSYVYAPTMRRGPRKRGGKTVSGRKPALSRSKVQEWNRAAQEQAPARGGQQTILPKHFVSKGISIGHHEFKGTREDVDDPKSDLIADIYIDAPLVRNAYNVAILDMERVTIGKERAYILSAAEDLVPVHISRPHGVSGTYDRNSLLSLANELGELTMGDIKNVAVGSMASAMGGSSITTRRQAITWLRTDEGKQWLRLQKEAIRRGEISSYLEDQRDLHQNYTLYTHGTDPDKLDGIIKPYSYHYQPWGGKHASEIHGYGGAGNVMSSRVTSGGVNPGDIWMQHQIELLTGQPTSWYSAGTTEGDSFTRILTPGSRAKQIELAQSNPIWARTYWATFSDADPQTAHSLRVQLYRQGGVFGSEVPTPLYELGL